MKVARPVCPVRLSVETIARVDCVVAELSRQNHKLEVNRSKVLRIVITRGLEALEAELCTPPHQHFLGLGPPLSSRR